MTTHKSVLSVALAAVFLAAGCGPSGATIAQQRETVLSMEAETLQRLYAEAPEAKAKVKKSAGYAVFSNANVNLILASMGGGYGVAVNNKTGQKTYMRMGEGGLGIGLGAKDYRVVLIFKAESAFNRFVESGWEFGGHADAAAKAGDKGGEASGQGDISGDVETYAMTESGLALQATVTGTKYWKDDDLNVAASDQ